jgi:CheY-like chemotaxis protein
MSSTALRVVYAEDDPLVRDTAAEMLRELGAEVSVCRNGAEAVLLCLSVNPDVALLDLSMLGMDGFDGARRIRANDVVTGKRIRLVALSGRTPGYEAQARTAGFDEFLRKPISVNALLGALRAPACVVPAKGGT